ncbi:LysR family transcriptional regulator [Cupriavidus basilensis]|uniref:LysR family transcriptional regulator n=1 Tax=Cupriavidus basilensis TaxID=68895 RepID=A0ABT6AV60_9BURK|nr:LysR family transcriptional regulator [Cupriavidus basilensis]MDF3836349.1 LysR family transcriptional regulator [Cupriavidus basilensis]
MPVAHLNAMAVFARVVECGSFSAAARELGMTPSAVSRHVTRLEAAIGGSLLQRTTRAFSLTELGQAVHAACARMVAAAQEVNALAGDHGGTPHGLLRVSAPVAFGQAWLAPRLPALLDRFPALELQLTLADRMVDLVEEGIDVAIRIARELAPGLAARPIRAVRYRLVASPGWLARHGTPPAPAALADHRCLYLGYGAFGERWSLRHQGDGQAVTLRIPPRATLNNSAAIVAMAQAGGGIGLVPDFSATAALASGSLVTVLDDWEILEPYVGTAFAVYTPTRHLAPKVRAFVDHLVAQAELENGTAGG